MPSSIPDQTPTAISTIPIDRTTHVSVARGRWFRKRLRRETTASPQTPIPAAANTPNGIARRGVNVTSCLAYRNVVTAPHVASSVGLMAEIEKPTQKPPDLLSSRGFDASFANLKKRNLAPSAQRTTAVTPWEIGRTSACRARKVAKPQNARDA